MAIAYVASSGAEGKVTSTTISKAFGVSTSTGQLLVVFLGTYGQTPPAPGAGSFSDDRGNTWTRHANYVDTDYNRGAIYSAIAKDSGTVTVTATVGSPSYLTVVVAAFSGAANNTADAASRANTTNGNPSTDVHHGNLSTSGAGLIVGRGGSATSGASGITQDANWALIAEREEDYYNHSACYRITSGSGTYNDGWTLGASKRWGAVGVAFLAASTGGLSIPIVNKDFSNSLITRPINVIRPRIII